MNKKNILLLTITGLVFSILTCGCIERELKIDTTPDGAMVELNDEQIGQTPVTVSFNWYGDYYVRLTKDGYETLSTHRNLKAPWYDHFPFDFFVGVLWPDRIVDSHEWTFELEEKKEITRDELLQKADELQKEMVTGELLNAVEETED